MNRRINKKLKRRLGYKSYKNYRNLVNTYMQVNRVNVMNLNRRIYPRSLVIEAVNRIGNDTMIRYMERYYEC